MMRFLDNPVVLGLGLTVFHALWEVALLGLAAWAGLFLLRRRGAETRYAFACAGLAAMVALPALTFLHYLAPFGQAPRPFSADGSILALMEFRDGGTLAALLGGLRTLTPWLALAWILGTVLKLFRLAGGLWWLDRHYVAPSRPAPEAWQAIARNLAERLGVRRDLRLRIARTGDSPLVIGWFRPVILVPAAAFLNLAPEALEAVLAHEIAHVRRSDFLANLLQSLAESLLFFHPAAWWLSGHVRELREHCCDDVAARLCGDPMALAEGLSALERLRRTFQPESNVAPDPASGLALGAAKGQLMPRITRLFSTQEAIVPSFRGLALLLAAASLVGAATLAAQGAAKPKPVPAAQAAVPGEPTQFDFSQIRVRKQPPAPAYPADAKAKGIQGTVVVIVTIDEKGRAVETVAESGPEELRPVAVDYASKWVFAPAKINGKATRARFKLTMPFKLR
jgi:D-alanyl-D-alanine endopeptidase (penicillin-binding protein 7)